MKNKILFTLLFVISLSTFSQQKITWEDLANVSFVDKYSETYGQSFLFPIFSESVKDLKGKKVTITGYFLNLDPEGESYVLSKGPMAACFFCGIGGPETAAGLKFVKKPEFETDDIITVTGVLKLNDDDVTQFNYILTDATAKISE